MRISVRTIAMATVVAAGSILAGCATTHVGDDWECPVIHGVPCQSVVDADPARVDTPPVEVAATADDKRLEKCPTRCRPFGWLRRALAGSRDDGAPGQGTDPAGPGSDEASASVESGLKDLRLPEVIGRIWIAPYVDDAGVYREAAWVRVVLQPARWKRP